MVPCSGIVWGDLWAKIFRIFFLLPTYIQYTSHNNPLSPPSDPVQRRLQNPPAKSKFLAVFRHGSVLWERFDEGALTGQMKGDQRNE